jgi:hypothetical protein
MRHVALYKLVDIERAFRDLRELPSSEKLDMEALLTHFDACVAIWKEQEHPGAAGPRFAFTIVKDGKLTAVMIRVNVANFKDVPHILRDIFLSLEEENVTWSASRTSEGFQYTATTMCCNLRSPCIEYKTPDDVQERQEGVNMERRKLRSTQSREFSWFCLCEGKRSFYCWELLREHASKEHACNCGKK